MMVWTGDQQQFTSRILKRRTCTASAVGVALSISAAHPRVTLRPVAYTRIPVCNLRALYYYPVLLYI